MKCSVYKNEQLISSFNFKDEMNFGHDVLVGRGENCQIFLNDQKISRQYATVQFKDGKAFIKKLNSPEPMYINGQQLDQKELKLNDKISFSGYRIVIDELANQASKDNTNSVTSSEQREQFEDSATVIDRLASKKIQPDESSYGKISSEETNVLKSSIISSIKENSYSSDDDATALENMKEYVEPDPQTSTSKSLLTVSTLEDKKEKTSSQLDISHSLSQGPSLFEEDVDFTSGPEMALDIHQSTDSKLVEKKKNEEPVSDDKTRVIKNFIQYVLIFDGQYAPKKEYVMKGKKINIGRSKKCEVMIDDPQMSSQHLRLLIENNICFAEDLGSVNGTYLNGEKITNKVQINAGDEIFVGSTIILLEIYSDQLAKEASSLMPVEVAEDRFLEKGQEGGLLPEDGEIEQNISEAMGSPQKSKDLSGKIKAYLDDLKSNPRKRIILLVVVFAIILLTIPVDEETTGSQATKGPPAPAVATAQPAVTAVEGETIGANISTPAPVPLEKKFSQEQMEYLESHYALANSHLQGGNYSSALNEIDLVKSVDPNYKQVGEIEILAKEGLAKIEELEKKKQEEEERERRLIQVKEFLDKAKEALAGEQIEMAESYMAKIYEIDPENSDVAAFKLELEAVKKAKEERDLEEARKKAERERMIELITPGKSAYLQQQWYVAVGRLEDFIKLKGLDEDLLLEATKMINESKDKLAEQTMPLIEQARSYKNAQDLKNAYEKYLEVLKINPGNDEANTEVIEIREILSGRAKKIFREALIAESLSLVKDAQEKYREVLQVAPSDSDYFKKANQKIKENSWGE